MSVDRQHVGRQGERIAAAELTRRGYAIVEQNWRCSAGEVDIVARQGPDWVFVEVRTRTGSEFGTPEESLTPSKQTRMIAVAQHYLAEHDLDDVDWRLDVVAVELDRTGRPYRVQVLENAVEGS